MPILMASLTPTVLKRRPLRSAVESMPVLTCSASVLRCMLHGLPSHHTDAMPT